MSSLVAHYVYVVCDECFQHVDTDDILDAISESAGHAVILGDREEEADLLVVIECPHPGAAGRPTDTGLIERMLAWWPVAIWYPVGGCKKSVFTATNLIPYDAIEDVLCRGGLDELAWWRTLRKLVALHRMKAHDYGTRQSAFENLRQSERFGVPAWLAAVIRANDKISRIAAFRQNGELKCEPVEDALIDLANYGVIAHALFRERER